MYDTGKQMVVGKISTRTHILTDLTILGVFAIKIKIIAKYSNL